MTDSKETELKPCGCGGAAELRHDHDEDPECPHWACCMSCTVGTGPKTHSSIVRQLSVLFEEENYLDEKTHPNSASFIALLRVLMKQDADLPPSLGVSDQGDIIASWLKPQVWSLSIKFDHIARNYSWVYINNGSEDEREKDSAAGHSSQFRIMEAIGVYLDRIKGDAINVS